MLVKAAGQTVQGKHAGPSSPRPPPGLYRSRPSGGGGLGAGATDGSLWADWGSDTSGPQLLRCRAHGFWVRWWFRALGERCAGGMEEGWGWGWNIPVHKSWQGL